MVDSHLEFHPAVTNMPPAAVTAGVRAEIGLVHLLEMDDGTVLGGVPNLAAAGVGKVPFPAGSSLGTGSLSGVATLLLSKVIRLGHFTCNFRGLVGRRKSG